MTFRSLAPELTLGNESLGKKRLFLRHFYACWPFSSSITSSRFVAVSRGKTAISWNDGSEPRLTSTPASDSTEDMKFHDYTIGVGDKVSGRVQDSTSLLPAAVEVFRDMLERFGPDFKQPVPVIGNEYVLSFTSESEGCAVATFFWNQRPITTSVLLCGGHAIEEERMLLAVQRMLIQLYRQFGVEPAFDLLAIADRPLLASVMIPLPLSTIPPSVYGLIGDAETCLAAAFFQT